MAIQHQHGFIKCRWPLVTFFVLVFSFMIGTLEAQYVIKALPRWMVSAHGELLFPQDEITRFVDGTKVAYHVEVQYRVKYNKPFLAGLYWGEMGLSKYAFNYVQSGNDGDIRIRERANTRRMEFGFTAGFYPEVNWLIQPYVQGRFGLALFQSSSILKDRDEQEIIERISEARQTVPAYGIDMGVHIVPNIWFVRIDARVGYRFNPSATYLALDEENKGTTGFPIDYFKSYTSSGQWLKCSLGVSYLF